jgi:glutathione S-transferase
MKLYFSPGNANLAPHMILEEIGIPFELVLVDRANNQHLSPEYLKLNPSGRIPVLVDGDLVLFETAAICLHLADTHPEANLAPALRTAQRANLYKWLMYMTNTLQTELLTYFYPDRLCDDEITEAKIKEKAESRVGSMLDILETALKENAEKKLGRFLIGEQFTILDPFLFMLCRWTRGMGCPAKSRPYLAGYLEHLSKRPATIRTFEKEGIEAPYY